MSNSERSDFERTAADDGGAGIFTEVWGYLRDNRKWWLVPIIVVLVLFGALMLASGTGLAPFIYTLF